MLLQLDKIAPRLKRTLNTVVPIIATLSLLADLGLPHGSKVDFSVNPMNPDRWTYRRHRFHTTKKNPLTYQWKSVENIPANFTFYRLFKSNYFPFTLMPTLLNCPFKGKAAVSSMKKIKRLRGTDKKNSNY